MRAKPIPSSSLEFAMSISALTSSTPFPQLLSSWQPGTTCWKMHSIGLKVWPRNSFPFWIVSSASAAIAAPSSSSDPPSIELFLFVCWGSAFFFNGLGLGHLVVTTCSSGFSLLDISMSCFADFRCPVAFRPLPFHLSAMAFEKESRWRESTLLGLRYWQGGGWNEQARNFKHHHPWPLLPCPSMLFYL